MSDTRGGAAGAGRGEALVMAFDIGTTGAKTCLYRLGPGDRITLLGSAGAEYALRFLPGGGVEQDPEDWWKAAAAGARKVLAEAAAEGALGAAGAGGPSRAAGAEAVRAIAFCSQMQGLVLVDREGRPVRPAMSYMDQRATEERRRGIARGLTLAGLEARKLLPSLAIAGGVSASAKDPVWKYAWVREREPELFARAATWLDAKEYLVLKATGRAAMTPDSANATFLYDTRPSRLDARGLGSWSPLLCRLFGVDPAHLPEVLPATEAVGPLLPRAAAELGLAPGIPVFGGGGDLSLVALGSGAVEAGSVHAYMGTSGWVSAVTERRAVDTERMIAAVMGADRGRYNYISELETAGKCLEWVRDHLVLDEVGAYLDRRTVAEDPEARYASLYELLDETMAGVAPGADGVLFAPWLHGNRSPFEDPAARGIFMNIGLDAGKRSLVRAVAEGIAYHARWQLESLRRGVEAKGPLRFVGGGARSAAIGRILASVTGESVEATEAPQNAGALGAALVCARGLGWLSSLGAARALVPVRAAYEPEPGAAALYDRRYAAWRRLYPANRAIFAALNGSAEGSAEEGEA